MKKIGTIKKEMQKLKKYIKDHINDQDEDKNIKQNVLDSLETYIILAWVTGKCKWTPSKIYKEK